MKNEKHAFYFGISAVLLWSTVASAFKITLASFTPVQMLIIASLVSILVLTLICHWQGKLPQVYTTFLQKPLYFIVLGLINPCLYYFILFQAYDLLPASQAQPLNYSWAITLSVMAAFFLKQKLTKYDLVACILGYFGVLVIATQGNVLALEFTSAQGVSLALLSTLLWAGYWILNAKNTADPVISMLLGFILSLPFSFGLLMYQNQAWQNLDFTAWLAVTYVGLFEMGITFVLWLYALKKTNHTSRISNLIFLSPFISLFLLSKIIGEEVGISTVAGLVLILCGLIVQQMKKTAKPVDSSTI